MSIENNEYNSQSSVIKEFAVIRRSDGLYKSNVTLDHGRRKTVYGKTEEEVRRKIREVQENSYLGKEESEIKFRDYFSQWLITTKKKSLKPTSFDRLERTFQTYLEPEIGGAQIGKLTTFRLQALINKYSDRLSYSSVKKIYQAINACLKYAVAVGSIPKNPMNAVEMPRAGSFKVETKQIVIPTDEELDKLFEAAETAYKCGTPIYNQNYVAIYKFIIETGLRIGEALALTWDKISFEKHTARIEASVCEIENRKRHTAENRYQRIVTDPKTKSGKRVIFLNDRAMAVLESVRQRSIEKGFDSDVVFVNSTGKPASYHEVQRCLTLLCDRAKIKRFGIHTLRHYFASKCIANGAEILALSKYLGHSKPSITMNVYAHLTETQDLAFQGVLNSLS